MPEGPQYTSCVEKADFVTVELYLGVADVAAAIAAILAVIAGFPAAGVIIGFAAGAEILRKVAEWLLTRKLICLKSVKRRVFDDPDPDRVCVLGTVLDFEKVGEDKSGFETIDNDFALNLLLAPTPLAEISRKELLALPREAALAALTHTVELTSQGDLIQDPNANAGNLDLTALPRPLVRKDDGKNFGAMPKGFTGYSRSMMFSAAYPRLIPKNVYGDPHELVKVDPKFAQLADDAYGQFFTEVQGNVTGPGGQPLSQEAKDEILSDAAADPLGQARVAALFYEQMNAAFAFVERQAPALHCEFEGARIRDVYNVLDFAHVHCDSGGFLGFLCDLLNLIISLFLAIPKLIAAAAAWALAKDGKLSDAYDGKGGDIAFGDLIVVKGRWAYDGGHDGYNEIHAVRTVQKTPASDAAGFIAFHDQWCAELGKVPPGGAPPVPGTSSTTGGASMTPAQQATHDAQARPENRWTYHPAIDGCVPAADDLPPADRPPDLH